MAHKTKTAVSIMNFMGLKRALFGFLICAAITNGAMAQSAAYSANHTLQQVEWLLGKWERQDMKPGRSAFEIWISESDTVMAGIGYTLQNTDTVFVEKLKLVQQGEELFYVADVAHNLAPVYFKITKISSQGFVCENPGHDFPKKISYQYDGDRLSAEVSADGKSQLFLFVKMD